MVNVTPTPTQYTYINLYTHLVCGVGVGSVWPPLKISCLCIGCCDLMFVSIWKKLLFNMDNVTPTPTSNTHFKHLSITFWKAPGCFWAHAVCIENCLWYASNILWLQVCGALGGRVCSLAYVLSVGLWSESSWCGRWTVVHASTLGWFGRSVLWLWECFAILSWLAQRRGHGVLRDGCGRSL